MSDPIEITINGGRERPDVNPFEIQPGGTPEGPPEEPAETADSPSFGDAVSAAVNQQWMVGPDEVEQWSRAPSIDPDFRWDDGLLGEVTQDIPEELWGAFDDAMSAEHARNIRSEVLSDMENQRVLDEVSGGWALQLGAAIADPTAIAVTVGTTGAGAGATAGAKLTKLQRFMTMLGVNVATDLAIESAVVANDSTQSWDNLVYAGLASAALNSAIVGRQVRNTARADINQQMADALQGQADAVRRGEALPSDSAGAARANVYEPISETAEDLADSLKDTPRTSYGPVRLDVVGKLKSSDNPIFRELGGRLAEDALGNADNSVNRFGATEYRDRLFRTFDTEAQRAVTPAYRAWAQERGIGPFGKWFYKEREAFMRDVAEYIRTEGTEGVARQFDGNVARAGDAYRTQYAKLLAEAKNAGVRGFENVDINPNYLPRFFDFDRIAELNRVYGSEQVRNLIAASLRSANGAVTAQQAKKFARTYLDKIRGVGANVDLGLTRGLTGEDSAALREALQDAVDLDPVDIDAIVGSVMVDAKGGHSRSKRRALLDEGYRATLARSDNSGSDTVSVSELFNNNAEHVFDLYNRQLSGAIALGKAGFSSPSQVVDMINKGRAVAGDLPGYTKVDRDADLAEFLLNQITGRPTAMQGGQDARFTTTGRTLQALRDFNFLRLMGNLGLAQIPEAGRILGELGWRNAIKALPALKGMMRDMQTGKLSSELLDEFEGMIGTGSEYLTSTVYNRVGVRLEGDDFSAQGVSPGAGRWETRIAHAKRVMTQVSGMMPVNTVLYRWTSAAMAHRWVNMATGAETISTKRLAWLGLSDEMHQRILEQIRKHGSYEASELGRATKVQRMNVDQWSDPDAAEAFAMASHRLSRNVIQANDPGTLPKWVSSSPLMQTIWQFRSFMWGAWSKQTLHGIKMRDFPAVSALMAATVLGGMAHSLRAYTVSLGMSDDRRRDYLDKQLSPSGIAAGSFLRAGQSSLIPMVVDSMMDLSGQGPFQGYRGSGLASGILGNPTVDLLDSTGPQVGNLIAGEESEASARRALSLLPFQNVIGMQQALNALADEIGN
ncbi:MAG: hypothetical protein KDJ27_03890 [Gammaproteobacteria bacterium]|nr:hypothetical protein [Gammaproteobacteria bacterium]